MVDENLNLITLTTIRKRKIDRSRAWLLGPAAKALGFPAAAVKGNPSLWRESEIDCFVLGLIERASAAGRVAAKPIGRARVEGGGAALRAVDTKSKARRTVAGRSKAPGLRAARSE